MAIANNDSEMVNLNVADIFPATGNIQFAGSLKNMGGNTLNSVDLKWQVDNGEIHTQTLSNLNLALGVAYDFVCADAWTPTPGEFTVRIWTENPNGVVDTDLTNDQLSKAISVASNSATRLPLYEKFSSSTCGPCYSFNTNYFNNFFANNHNNLALINYQVNWPGSGDPYFTPEVGSRVSFYGINAAPTLLVNSVDGTDFSSGLLQNTLNAELAKPAFFMLSATKELIGSQMSVSVDVTPYLSGNYTMQVAVVEKVTTGNIASNGETEFHNVMMKMMPNPSGTALTCVRDEQQTIQLSTNLSATNIEELTDLDVVVFIQDANKRIMQAAYAQLPLANAQFGNKNTIAIYPNPTTGMLRVNSATPVDVTITDLTGKTVLVKKAVTNETAMDLSAFQTGVYMAKLDNGTAVETQKIILK